ncbi:MAG: aminoacetone oxidase family FAD-binding enzyme [Angelakisella sp.]|nr:aminoacetone oxidase family FAD-binding enzyme [Angelakisella sp.]
MGGEGKGRWDAIVIGGGAAGLLCAGYAARRGLSVLVAEGRERPARKILVTGKGRCNLTNNCSPEDFLKNVCSNPKFLYSAIWGYPPASTMALFEELGVPLKTERGNRVYPVSDSARSIADALVGFAKNSGAKILQAKVAEILLEEGRAVGVRTTGGEEYRGRNIVLAAGGMSYPGTGSDGSGFALARQAGHTITPLRGSLVPILCAGDCCGRMAGLSLKNVTLTLREEGKKKPVFQELGEMLFTHQGVSGPLVLSASALMRKPAGEYRLFIDMKPALDPAQLDARLLRDFSESPNRDLGNVLSSLLPRAFVLPALEAAELPPDRKVREVTREERRRLGERVKAFPLVPTALGPVEEAVVTAGGVKVSEVDPKTMASRLVPGLYFAGEVLDVDARTGGFNLQIAFATGYAAAMHLE